MLPFPKLALYGFQHVLAFYAGAVVVPIILASAVHLSAHQLVYLINADLFTCGIASIIQALGFWKIGVRLPLVQGVTFTAVSPMIAIGLGAGGGTAALLAIYGAVIVAGMVTFAAAPFIGRLIRFFPPVVSGTVITIIGIVLLPVALTDAAGGAAVQGTPDFGSWRHLAYSGGTLLFILLLFRFGRPILRSVAVLIGLVGATAVAYLLGDVHFSEVGRANWLGVSTPFHYGLPTFQLGAIVAMILVMLVTAIETTGDVHAAAEIVGKRVAGDDVARALRADGLATFLGGVLNSFPYTCFAENIGLIRLTKVRSRFVVVAAGVFMMVLGVLPKAGAVVAAIPNDVLGGAATAMFGTVAAVGIQSLARVNLRDERNAIIVAVSLAAALFPTTVPAFGKNLPTNVGAILNSGITLGSLMAITLNVIFNVLAKRREEQDEYDLEEPAEQAFARG